jgi:hypothetical protein
MARISSKRVRARKEAGDSPLTVGEREDLRNTVMTRLRNADRLSHRGHADPRVGGAAAAANDQRQPIPQAMAGPGLQAGPPPGAGQLPASPAATREQAQAQQRRQYRQQKLGIQDLRHATAEQIAAAQKDRNALLGEDDLAQHRAALAEKQLRQGITAEGADLAPVGNLPGKPAGAGFQGGPLGGRRPPQAGGQPLVPTLRRRRRRSPAQEARSAAGGR